MTVAPIIGLASPAGAAPPAPVDPIGAGNFCEAAGTTEPFTDVSDADPAQDHIACLVATQITTGVTATTYEPNSFVTRRQMALFLVRTAAEADRLEIGDNIEELPAAAANTFTDVADESQAVRNAISQLDQADVANGFPDNTYRPEAPVSRRQMAAFIDRLYEYLTGAELPRATEDYFADDNADSDAAESSTNAVARAGIFTGNTDGTFRPAQEITRRQMAFVLTRTLQVLFENGEINKFSAPGTSNQTFTASPAGAVENPTSTDNTTNEGAETFTFTGVTGPNVTVALLPCSNVTVTDGVVSLADAEATGVGSSEADDLGDSDRSEAVIEQINGAAPDTATFDDTINAVNGAVTVVVDSEQFDCTVVVLFSDSDNDGELDLDANNRPTEPFGLAGPLTFMPAEAPNGFDECCVDVLLVDEANNYFIGDTGTETYIFRYDANDTFEYNENDYTISLEQFELALSAGDSVDVGDLTSYSRTGQSSFDLYDDVPSAPTGVTATAGDFDNTADAAADDVRVTWTAATDALIASYTVELYTDVVATPGCETAVAPVATQTVATTQASFTELGDGTYCAVVFATSQTGTSGPDSAPAFVAVDALPNDTVAPTVTDARVITDNDSDAIIEATDVLRLDFSESLEAAGLEGQPATISVTDAQGETFNITGTVALSDNDAVVNVPAETDRVTFTVTAVAKTGGIGDGAANLPLTITGFSGEFEDAAGNVATTTGSTDLVIDFEV